MKRKKSDFLSNLTKDDKMLVILRDELYSGSWKLMIDDLEARLKMKPYVFKLSGRIDNDLKRIKRLLTYEKRHKIDLAQFMRKIS